MDKYCTNCGNEINLESDYCLKCGKKIIKRNTKNSKKNTIEIISIVSMTLGLISFYISFILALGLSSAIYEVNDIVYNVERDAIIYKSLFAFFYTIIPLILGIPGLIMSISSLKKEKNIYASIGLISSLVSLVFCIVIIIFLIK